LKEGLLCEAILVWVVTCSKTDSRGLSLPMMENPMISGCSLFFNLLASWFAFSVSIDTQLILLQSAFSSKALVECAN